VGVAMENNKNTKIKIVHILILVMVISLTVWNIIGIVRNNTALDKVIGKYNEVKDINEELTSANKNLQSKLNLYDNNSEKSQKNNSDLLYDIAEYKDKLERIQGELELSNELIKNLTDETIDLESELYDAKAGEYVIVDDNLDTDIIDLVIEHFRSLADAKEDLFNETIADSSNRKVEIAKYYEEYKGIKQKIKRISYNGEGVPPLDMEFYLLVYFENGTESVRVPGVVKEDDEWRIFDHDFK